jgi:hypothetical protein
MTPRTPWIRTVRDDRSGVSQVLGGILMFGLLVVTLVVVQTRFVPVWDEDREARHMDSVANQLSAVISDVQRLAANQSSASIADPLTLDTDGGFRFFQGPTVPGGGLSFSPTAANAGFNVTSTNLRVFRRNGQDLFGLGETWVTISGAAPVDDVLAVDHLRVRVNMQPDYDEGDSATLTVTDANGAFAGRAVVTFRDFPSEHALETKIYNSANQQISSDLEAFFQQTAVDYFYVDLLDDGLLFDQVLAVAQTPFDVALSTGGPNGLEADYTLAATTLTGTPAGAGGLVIPNYRVDLPSGALSFAANNQRFPSQTFVVENGALLVVQSDGVAMRVPPAMRITATSTQAVLSWTLPGLTGDASNIGGGTTASIVATPTGARNDVTGAAPLVTLRVPTAYPDVWATWLDDQMRGAGLSSTNGQYTVTPAAASVTLTLFGPNSSAVTEDVILSLQQSTIRLDLRPTG